MNLEANASRANGQDRQRGYAMAALLVMMAVMAVLMTVALPTWKLTVQRELPIAKFSTGRLSVMEP